MASLLLQSILDIVGIHWQGVRDILKGRTPRVLSLRDVTCNQDKADFVRNAAQVWDEIRRTSQLSFLVHITTFTGGAFPFCQRTLVGRSCGRHFDCSESHG